MRTVPAVRTVQMAYLIAWTMSSTAGLVAQRMPPDTTIEDPLRPRFFDLLRNFGRLVLGCIEADFTSKTHFVWFLGI